MKKIAWFTDLHLSDLNSEEYEDFLSSITSYNVDAAFITGDISDSTSVVQYLEKIADTISKPIYFVLGNHDYFYDKIKNVKNLFSSKNLFYLSNLDFIELSENVALIGHDGWYDGRSGDFNNSSYICPDFSCIEDFIGLTNLQRLEIMHNLADEATEHLTMQLSSALEKYDKVILLTHIPPFWEACLFKNKRPTDDTAPYFVNFGLGESLYHIMINNPEKHLEIFCGHTHSKNKKSILPNLLVNVCAPQKQQIITI